MGEVLLGLE